MGLLKIQTATFYYKIFTIKNIDNRFGTKKRPSGTNFVNDLYEEKRILYIQTQSSSVNTIYRFVSKSLSIGPVVVTVSTGALQASSLSSILNRSTSITVNMVRNFHPERYGWRICNIYFIIYVSGGS